MDFLKYIPVDNGPAYNVTAITQNQAANNLSGTQAVYPANVMQADPISAAGSGYVLNKPVTAIGTTQTTAGGTFQIPPNFKAGEVLFFKNGSAVSVNVFPPYDGASSGQLNGAASALAVAAGKAVIFFPADGTGKNWFSLNTANLGA